MPSLSLRSAAGQRGAHDAPEPEPALAPHVVVPGAGDDIFGRFRHADLAAFAVDGPFRLAVGHKMGIIYARHLPYLLLAEKPFGHKTLAPHPVHEGRRGLLLIDGKGQHPVGPHIVGELSLAIPQGCGNSSSAWPRWFRPSRSGCHSWGSDRSPARRPFRKPVPCVRLSAPLRRSAAGPPERSNGKTGTSIARHRDQSSDSRRSWGIYR